MKIAAIYAVVSAEQQTKENTIASRTAAVLELAREQGCRVLDASVIENEGFVGVIQGFERGRAPTC